MYLPVELLSLLNTPRLLNLIKMVATTKESELPFLVNLVGTVGVGDGRGKGL